MLFATNGSLLAYVAYAERSGTGVTLTYCWTPERSPETLGMLVDDHLKNLTGTPEANPT